MARFQYGGQALIEGVLMRGRSALAVALRHTDGSIVWATERLDLGLRARRATRLPFVRGLVVLYDTLVTGTRWLVRSATLQALAEEEAQGNGKGGAAGGTGRGVAGSAAGTMLRPKERRAGFRPGLQQSRIGRNSRPLWSAKGGPGSARRGPGCGQRWRSTAPT